MGGGGSTCLTQGKQDFNFFHDVHININDINVCPDDVIIKSNILPISVIVTKSMSTFIFAVTIGNEKFNVSGTIQEPDPGTSGGSTNSFPLILSTSSTNVAVQGHLFKTSINGIIYTFQRDNTVTIFQQGWNFMVSMEKDTEKPINANGKNTPLLKSISQPQIFITSRLLIDLSDIGPTVFQIIHMDKIITYEESCPKIADVLKGRGKTARNKVNYLSGKGKINIDGIQFIDNLAEYSMIRCFLSKLLYGNFDTKYLLKKYYSEFIKDLQNSEYSNFVQYFLTGQLKDYYKYFH